MSKYAKGGYVPGPQVQCSILVREDGMVSFDGQSGPWSRVVTPEQIKEYGAAALAALNEEGGRECR